MSEAMIVMVTCASRTEAEEMAEQLLDERLVACVNIAGRVRSIYHWKGAIARESEQLLLMKTRAEHLERLSARVRELHSYDVPEIIAAPIQVGNPDYLKWLMDSTEPPGGG